MKVLLVVLASAIAVASAMPGGWSSEKDTKDSQWWTMLSGIKAHKGLLTAKNNFKIVSVKTQVVSGINYKFSLEKNGKTCEIQMWVQAWLNKSKVTKDNCTELAKEKRQLGGVTTLPGGVVTGGVGTVTDFDSEPGFKDCLGAMLDDINAQVNSMYRLVDSNIINVTKQVVAGWMYGLKMEVAPSTCMSDANSKGLTSTKCAVKSASSVGREIWSGRCWYKDWETPNAKMQELHHSGSS